MNKWKQTMLRTKAYDILKRAKESLSKTENRRLSLSDVIIKLIGKKLLFLISNADLKEYIECYVGELAKDRKVLGVILFGSVADGTWNKYSDIDLFVIVRGKPLDILHETNEIDKRLMTQQEKLLDLGIGLYASPLIVSRDRLNEFRPIYLEIIDKGIILYEKEAAVTNFINDVRSKISYKRISTPAGEVLTWKEKRS
jgi:predicted nucleotidyltransferase